MGFLPLALFLPNCFCKAMKKKSTLVQSVHQHTSVHCEGLYLLCQQVPKLHLWILCDRNPALNSYGLIPNHATGTQASPSPTALEPGFQQAGGVPVPLQTLVSLFTQELQLSPGCTGLQPQQPSPLPAWVSGSHFPSSSGPTHTAVPGLRQPHQWELLITLPAMDMAISSMQPRLVELTWGKCKGCSHAGKLSSLELCNSPKSSVKEKKPHKAFYKEYGNMLSSTSHSCETRLSSSRVILVRKVLRAPTELSVPAMGFYKQRASSLQTEGVIASISTEPILKPKPKALNTHFRKKLFQSLAVF